MWTRVMIALLGAVIACSASGSPQGTPPGERLAQASWWDRTAPGRKGAPTSKHYRIRSDLPLEETRRYAEHQDAMYKEYMKRLQSLRPRTPPVLDVLMFAKRQDYVDTLRTRFGINGTGSGGMFFISPHGAALAYFTEGLPESRVKHVIQHEGFHQVAHAYFGSDLPPWISEGLAEYFGEAIRVGDDIVLGQSRPDVVGRLADASAAEEHLPFLDLLDMNSERWNANVQSGDAALQYNQSWSMVHFLVHGDDGKYQAPFETLLRLLNEGVPSMPAFNRAFGLNDAEDVREFENRWRAFAQAMQPSPFATALERMEFLAEGMKSLKGSGAWPATLDELKARLREKDFTYALLSHGYRRRLKAEDDKLFSMPGEQGAFALEAFDPSALRRKKDRDAEAADPTPPSIVTQGLAPRDIRVNWIRTSDGGWTWEAETLRAKSARPQ